MKQLLLWLIGLSLLVGCNDGVQTALGRTLNALATPTTWAWGERVLIANAGAKSVRVTRAGVVQTFALTPGQPVFDLPVPPSDTDTASVEVSVTPQTYWTRLDPTPYAHRGTVEVLDAGGRVLLKQDPFGSVANGLVSFVASRPVQAGCAAFFSSVNTRLAATGVPGFGLASEDRLEVKVADVFALCAATVNVGRQGTDASLALLETALAVETGYVAALGSQGYVTDKNTVMNLMQIGGAWSYDPTCTEIQTKLDPISSSGYALIPMVQLRADLNLSATTLTGSGVNVFVIGGGFGASDPFDCRPGYEYAKHDTHAGSLIQTIAPGATVQALGACSSSGVCRASDIVRALMTVVGLNLARPTLIDMSLGGPQPNRVMYALLELLRVRYNAQVIASGGNTRRASAQYPASYSSGVAAPGQPSLSNVISVGATGVLNGGYRIAGFNTRANADVFAQGVNLCPDSVAGHRCLNLSPPSVRNLGVTGSSYAAPVAIGVAALLIQRRGAMPADLRACLINNLKTDPVTGVSSVALMNGACP